jgi:PAS domain S-box-containing protein
MTSAPPDALIGYMRDARIALALGAKDEPDEPLVEVNEAFCRLTGYGRSDAIGRNCRFLQPEEDDVLAARVKMRAFLDDPFAEVGRFEVPNVRADGTRFTNLVFMSRLRGGSGRDGFIFASQFDLGRAGSMGDLKAYDAKLGRSIDDMADLARNHGLMMRQSAELLSQSAVTIANIRLHG